MRLFKFLFVTGTFTMKNKRFAMVSRLINFNKINLFDLSID